MTQHKEVLLKVFRIESETGQTADLCEWFQLKLLSILLDSHNLKKKIVSAKS
jgi:hypothetical protein